MSNSALFLSFLKCASYCLQKSIIVSPTRSVHARQLKDCIVLKLFPVGKLRFMKKGAVEELPLSLCLHELLTVHSCKVEPNQ